MSEHLVYDASGNLKIHHVYIFAHSEDGVLKAPVKVGITRSLNARLATVQTGSPRKIEVAYAFALPMRVLIECVERQFHEEAAEYRMHGEWFDMKPLDALWLLTDIMKDTLEEVCKQSSDREALQFLATQSGLLDAMKFITAQVAKQ